MKLNKVKIIIYSISGIMASISGLIITSRLSSAQPTAGASYEMDAIAAVVLGEPLYQEVKVAYWGP